MITSRNTVHERGPAHASFPRQVLIHGNWEFIEGLDGRYRWRNVDSRGQLLMESSTGFLFLFSCVKDAVRHGFVATSPAIAADG
jgi:hypothetical protein